MRRRCRVVAATGLMLIAAAGAVAEEPDRLCRFVLADEQIELDDLKLEFDLARSEFAAAEEIFALVDKLWKNDAIERIAYLNFLHDRDARGIDVERRRFQVERQDAVIEHYRHLCAVLGQGDDSAERARSLESAYQRYRCAHCTVLQQEVRLAEAVTPLGYEVESVPPYAPDAAWLVASDRSIASALSNLKALMATPGLESVEPQMLRPAKSRGER